MADAGEVTRLWRSSSVGEDHPWTWEARGGVGPALATLGREAEAAPLVRGGYEGLNPFAYANPAVVEELRQALE